MRETIDERKAEARADLEWMGHKTWIEKHKALLDQLLKPRQEWPTSHKFKRGDRVRLSAEGKKALFHIRAASHRPDEEYGTVVCKPRHSDKVSIRVDGYKFYSRYHIDFWEKV